MTASFLDHFVTLEDPRVECNQRHVQLDIVFLAVCAVVSGADGWEAIEDFGRKKLGWLRRFAPFANGVPSHDCISNVISRLTSKGFGECFRSWTRAVSGATGGEIIAVDGKSARGSRDRRRRRSPLHMVSAWACRNRLVLGQEASFDAVRPDRGLGLRAPVAGLRRSLLCRPRAQPAQGRLQVPLP
jgi:hypothetical protein